jgi:hypothetical protein
MFVIQIMQKRCRGLVLTVNEVVEAADEEVLASSLGPASVRVEIHMACTPGLRFPLTPWEHRLFLHNAPTVPFPTCIRNSLPRELHQSLQLRYRKLRKKQMIAKVNKGLNKAEIN